MTWNDLKKQTNPQIQFSISSPNKQRKTEHRTLTGGVLGFLDSLFREG